jgi:hypothetical protein
VLRAPAPATASQLRHGLRDAADDAGCSLNANAVQVLAAAAGDPGSIDRNESIETMGAELGSEKMVALVRRFDAEEPGYFVEWRRLRTAEREARESEGRRGAA